MKAPPPQVPLFNQNSAAWRGNLCSAGVNGLSLGGRSPAQQCQPRKGLLSNQWMYLVCQ